MGDFGYSKRGRDVIDAQAEVHAAFEKVADRNNTGDPRTRRWLDAIETFRAAYARVYPDALRQVDQGTKPASELETSMILDFLEPDPVFHRSGYMKGNLLTELKRRRLDEHDAARLQAIIIAVVQKPDRREFRRYCRVASSVEGQHFKTELMALERGSDPDNARRARWVLAALSQADKSSCEDR